MSERLGPLPDVRAVLFDVYGTLLTSKTGHAGPNPPSDAGAIDAALTAAGWPNAEIPKGLDVAAALENRVQASAAERRKKGEDYPAADARAIWRDVLAKILGTSPKKLDAAAIERFVVELECRINPVCPMPDLRETLAELRARDLKLGVVSDGQFYTPLVLEAALGLPPAEAGIEPSCSLYSYQIGVTKPSPLLYEEAMIALENEFAILSDEVLYVGSRFEEGILPANAMGFRTALYAGDAASLQLGANDLDAMSHAPPDRILTGLAQLKEVLRVAKPKDRLAGIDLEADIGGDD
nr:HAD family hydrolase [Thiorhodococcus mannitoliphagus]